MWVFNGNAVIAAGIGIAAGFGVFATTENQMLAGSSSILIAMAVDVWMRFHSEDCERPLIDPSAGAHLWFAPVWLVGMVLMMLLALSHFRIV